MADHGLPEATQLIVGQRGETRVCEKEVEARLGVVVGTVLIADDISIESFAAPDTPRDLIVERFGYGLAWLIARARSGIYAL